MGIQILNVTKNDFQVVIVNTSDLNEANLKDMRENTVVTPDAEHLIKKDT